MPFQILPKYKILYSLQAKKEVATQACTNDDNSMSGGSVTIVVDSTEAVISRLEKYLYAQNKFLCYIFYIKKKLQCSAGRIIV